MTLIRVKTPACPICQKSSELTLDEAEFQKWRNGALIQNAFPQLTNDQRELLISGTHPKCWDLLFGEPS